MDENKRQYRYGIEITKPIFVHKDFFIVDPYIVDNMLHILWQVAYRCESISEHDKEISRKILDLFN